jgi:predicted NAD/FAD-binding protein
MATTKKCIAIIGSGVSGIGALYALRNTEHEVHLFESASRLGGHTNTVNWNWKGQSVPVDTGFIVLNSFTYPNFIQFLKQLKIDTLDTDMSFSVTRDQGAFEWCGSNIKSLFAQQSNFFKPSFWRMIFDILRFNTFALDLLDDPNSDTNFLTMGSYLDQQGYSEAFKNDYLLPMTACVWSTGPEKCALDFPVVTLVRFMWNHHLLAITNRPKWKTIPGGSKKYLAAVVQALPPAREHLKTPINKIHSQTDRDGKLHYFLEAPGGSEFPVPFDNVIFACHADQALNILGDTATPKEREILQNFGTTPNIAYLHSDISVSAFPAVRCSVPFSLLTSIRSYFPSAPMHGQHGTISPQQQTRLQLLARLQIH